VPRILAHSCLVLVTLIAAVARGESTEKPVTLTDTGRALKLTNGYCTAVISKRNGDLTSLVYKDIETLGFDSGHPAGYWEQQPAGATSSITIDPATNDGQRAEVSIKGTAAGGVGGGTNNVRLEIRYTMDRSTSGIYTYAIFSHDDVSRPASIGESRYGAKLSNVFDWISIDEKRNKQMPTGADWDAGTPLNAKEIRRLNTGIYKGEVEHKYDYSAYQFKIPAFGWSSTTKHIGFYLINPTIEFLSGGATKYELTGHLDNNPGGAPTILDYWRGTHYGGSNCRVAAEEEWSKVVGPILVYLNSKENPNEMFQDALAQAKKEADAWPYDWVQGVDYPHKAERATVSGQLVLHDPGAASTKLPNLLVGLAFPDQPAPAAPPPAPGGGGRGFGFGRFGGTDWQNDAKHYQFWVQGNEDGQFTIPNVRPGTYQLHAIADGVLGEFSKQPITVKEGDKLDLGTLEWCPVRYGQQLWEVGIPNRQGSEFFKGDDYFHWGWYVQYPKLFPKDVNFEIGKSDFHKDWFFEQVPRDTSADNTTGRGLGDATPWSITWNQSGQPHGMCTLRVAICGSGTRSIDVSVNGKTAGTITPPMYNATINRDGIGGYWSERKLSFDAALLHDGQNTLTLTIPSGQLTSGVIYDYLRLELDASGFPM
jgi:rhamnogalacturonan endolyase